jgi:hypothetical protein
MSRALSSFAAALMLLAPIAAAAAPAGPPSPADRCLAGDYQGQAMEVGAQLHLGEDGRFTYGLAYGALDEQAEGQWENDGGAVYLTSDPVTPPQFTLLGESAGTPGEFHIALDLPHGISAQYFDALLSLSDGRSIQRQFGADGLDITLQPGEKVAAFSVLLPVFDLESDRFALAAGAASAVRVRFEPNDLDKIAFARERLPIDRGVLVLHRHDREIRFRRGSSNCGTRAAAPLPR